MSYPVKVMPCICASTLIFNRPSFCILFLGPGVVMAERRFFDTDFFLLVLATGEPLSSIVLFAMLPSGTLFWPSRLQRRLKIVGGFFSAFASFTTVTLEPFAILSLIDSPSGSSFDCHLTKDLFFLAGDLETPL